MGRARLDAISSMCCPSNVSPWQVMDHLTRNIHETLSSRPKIQDLMHILHSNQCCSIRSWKVQTFWQVYPSTAINHLLLVSNWWVSINFAGLWVDLDIWNDHLQLGFHINIALVRRPLFNPCYLQCSHLIGRLVLNPLLWLVDWQQRRVSCPISRVLILSWIRLDRMPVGGNQKLLPQIPISKMYTGPTPIQVSLMKYLYNFSCFGSFPQRMFLIPKCSFAHPVACFPKWWVHSSLGGTSKSGRQAGRQAGRAGLELFCFNICTRQAVIADRFCQPRQ